MGNVALPRFKASQYDKKRVTGSAGTGTCAAPDPDQLHMYDSAKANRAQGQRALADNSLPPTP